MEPFAGAALLGLVFVLTKLDVPAGDAIAVYAVFSFAAKIAQDLPLASVAGVSEKLAEATLAVGYLSAIVLGWRKRGATGGLDGCSRASSC